MTEKNIETLITAIKANTEIFNKIMSLLPLNKRLVNVIVTSVESERLHELLYIENFYQHIDQDMVDINYNKFISAINTHLYSTGSRQVYFDDYTNNHFYNSLIQNSISLTGTDLIFSDNRTEDDFQNESSVQNTSNSKTVVVDDLPF
jgi:hypothetical protein